MNRNYILVVLLAVLVLLTGCGTKSETLEKAVIHQVLANPQSLQEDASYIFEEGTLTISLSYRPSRNPNAAPTETANQEIIAEDMARFKQEFPDMEFSQEVRDNHFEKEFEQVTFKLNKEKQEITLSGKGITKVFQISPENERRLIDATGIEYELRLE